MPLGSSGVFKDHKANLNQNLGITFLSQKIFWGSLSESKDFKRKTTEKLKQRYCLMKRLMWPTFVKGHCHQYLARFLSLRLIMGVDSWSLATATVALRMFLIKVLRPTAFFHSPTLALPLACHTHSPHTLCITSKCYSF